jgi:hypothetical protein
MQHLVVIYKVESVKMNSKKKIALVTRGNRGIGFETCRQHAAGIVLNGFELVLLEKHRHTGTNVMSSNKKIPTNRRTY